MTESGCEQCPENTYSGYGASICTTCPSGKVSEAGSTSCGKLILTFSSIWYLTSQLVSTDWPGRGSAICDQLIVANSYAYQGADKRPGQ